MKVIGIVTSINTLPPRNGAQRGITFVGIEGFSLVPADGVELPQEGREIRATVAVHWRKGARPVHRLLYWEYV